MTLPLVSLVSILQTLLSEAKYSEMNATKSNEYVNAKLRDVSYFYIVNIEQPLLLIIAGLLKNACFHGAQFSFNTTC